ncbi:MAG: AraC family transcriptional regulator [Bacteroidota bacterium]
MEIFTLPEYFLDGTPDLVNVQFYQTENSTVKNKISLSQHLMCILLDGQKEIIDNSAAHKFDNGQFCLLSAGNVLMTERTSAERGYESLLFFYSNIFLLNLVEKYELALPEAQRSGARIRVLDKDDYVLNFQQSLRLLQDRILQSGPLRLAKLEEIFLYLIEKAPSLVLPFIRQALADQRHHSFTQIIQNHLYDNLTYEELAFLCNMSISTFKRRFSEAYQTTPKKYFISQRMKRAVFLLQNNKRPSEIYFELGYESLSSFSIEFKKHFGVSPRSYMLQS